MPVAAFRLTGSVSEFHDSALVSVMVHVTPDARNRPRPPWRGNACVCARGGPRRTGPTNGRRVSRVMSLPGARLPRRTHPEVSGVVPRAACRRSVGSGFTARVAWPPTFATMMHRPCDASRCFQTDRLGQRVP